MSKRSPLACPPARFLFPALLALVLGGCQTMSLEDVTGALGGKPESAGKADAKPDMDALRERYRAKPSDPNIALEYGKALREMGQRAQAVAVMEQAVLGHPSNKALLAGYGRALADSGNFQQAFDVLSRARPGGSRLAHPVGAGRGARPTRPQRGSAAILRHRAQDRARRAAGFVQSR